MNADVEKAVERLDKRGLGGVIDGRSTFDDWHTIRQALRDKEAEIAGLVAALKAAQWDCHGKCPVCAGWNMSPSGETRRKHTKDCPIGISLTTHLGATHD